MGQEAKTNKSVERKGGQEREKGRKGGRGRQRLMSDGG